MMFDPALTVVQAKSGAVNPLTNFPAAQVTLLTVVPLPPPPPPERAEAVEGEIATTIGPALYADARALRYAAPATLNCQIPAAVAEDAPVVLLSGVPLIATHVTLSTDDSNCTVPVKVPDS